ncbi:DEAD/DEAH box helicase [Chitinimonas lacunae]|uniref:SNF2-related protein n=1 Tax=Chitinimonas lacunae TaxID=1963018 RepID=A0ABV8MPJ4_9NEIS
MTQSFSNVPPALSTLPFYAALVDRFGEKIVASGVSYALDGRVQSGIPAVARGRTMLVGTVQCGTRKTFTTRLSFNASTPLEDLKTQCNCPAAGDCEHAVALLWNWLGEQEMLNGGETADEAPAPAVPERVSRWWQSFRAVAVGVDGYPPGVRNRLLYVLAPGEGGHRVVPTSCRLLADGSYDEALPFPGWSSAEPPNYLRPVDLQLLTDLAKLPADEPGYRLAGEWGAMLLRRMLGTGRCHWLQPSSPPLTAGPARAASVAWQMAEDGGQRLSLSAEPAPQQWIAVAPPFYLDADGSVGELDTGLSPLLAMQAMTMPTLAPKVAAHIAEEWQGLPLPLPAPAVLPVERRETAPRGVLRCSQGNLHANDWRTLRPLGETPSWIEAYCDYDGVRVPLPATGDLIGDTVLHRARGDLLLEMPRQPAAEAALAHLLSQHGLEGWRGFVFERPDPAGQPADHIWLPSAIAELDPEDPVAPQLDAIWLDLASELLPRLAELGWIIDYAEDFPYRLLHAGEAWLDIDDSGHDWFSLSLGVEVNGRRVELLPLLVEALQRFSGPAQIQGLPDDHPLRLRLPEGILVLPLGRLRPMLMALVELFDRGSVDPNGHLSLSRLDAGRLHQLEREGGIAMRGGETLRAFGRALAKLAEQGGMEAPAGFGAELRDYQKQGLAWLQTLREHGLAGILADDMGLGKTIQALAHILTEKRAGRLTRPALVVAPTSLVFNWRREAQQFAPELRIVVLHGPDRHNRYAEFDDADLILTTYPLLARDGEALLKFRFHLLILDEAQNIKNPRARGSQVCGALHANHRLCLTGTPLENHLGELWSLFHFLLPGLLGDADSFRRYWRTPIEKHGDGACRAALARRVSPFLLRRSKEQVAKELPAKTEILRTVELEGDQRDLYETLRLALHEELRATIAEKGWSRSQIVVLDALLKLRQACCDPRLVKLPAAAAAKNSAKLELLMDLLPELLAEGRRILLFSQFTSMLALIEEALVEANIPYVSLTGQTRDRAAVIDAFQEGQVPLFLISLKAGGVGLNLTAADTVIHYDPWWNPAVENQATDRAYRIGQDKPVFVYKLVTQGTVEEKILALQAHKRALADAILAEDASKLAVLDPTSLDDLFGPLSDGR